MENDIVEMLESYRNAVKNTIETVRMWHDQYVNMINGDNL